VLLHDITTYLHSCNNVIIDYICRQGNSAAHWLAKCCLSLHSTSVWDVVPHRDLGRILCEDNLRRTLENSFLIWSTSLSYPKKKKVKKMSFEFEVQMLLKTLNLCNYSTCCC